MGQCDPYETEAECIMWFAPDLLAERIRPADEEADEQTDNRTVPLGV
jgi:hypothetical protein